MSKYKPAQSADEVLQRYAGGERDFGHSELDTDIWDMQGVDLSSADFSHSFIFGDFRNATLRSVNFTGCNLKTCDFRGAGLTDAIFCGVALEGVEFDGALLTGADFEGANLFSHKMGAGELPDW